MKNHKIQTLTADHPFTEQIANAFQISEEDVVALTEGILQLKKNDNLTYEEGYLGMLLSGALMSYSLEEDPVSHKQEKNVHCLICNEMYQQICPAAYGNKHIRNLVEGRFSDDAAEDTMLQATVDSVLLMVNLKKIYAHPAIANIVNYLYRIYPESIEQIDTIKNFEGIREKKQKIMELFPCIFKYYNDKTIASFFNINYSSWKQIKI